MTSRQEDTGRPIHTRNTATRPSPAISWRSIGSMKIGVALMTVLAGAMASATFYEARTSREAAARVFYHSGWFATLLLALAVNIFVATIRRWPSSWRKIGFPITHLGILVILTGGLITNQFGFEGQLRLVEGETGAIASLPSLVVAAERFDRDGPQADELSVPMSAARTTHGLGSTARSKKLGLSVSYEAFWPNSRRVQRYEADSRGPAAVELGVMPTEGHAPRAVWLTRSDRSQRIDGLPIELIEGAMPSPAAAKSVEKESESGTLVVRDEGEPQSIPVAAALRQPVSLHLRGCSLRVRAYYPDAVVGQNHTLKSRSNLPRNPAVDVEITGPRGSEQRRLFAKFPDFARMHGRDQLYPKIDTNYQFTGASEESPSLRLYAGGTKLSFILIGDNEPVRRGEVILNAPIVPDGIGSQFRVLSYLSHARPIEAIEPAEPDEGDSGEPAVQAVACSGTATARVSLGWQQPALVRLGEASFRLMLRERAISLPVALRLNRFERATYPGTDRAAMFASHVTVMDAALGTHEERTIEMNRPLHVAGYTFFQSGFDTEGPRQATVLAVSRDPGKWWVYSGFVLVSGGIVLMMSLKRRSTGGRPASLPQRESSSAGLFGGAIPMRQAMTLVGLVCMLALPVQAAEPTARIIDVRAIELIPVQLDGRIAPFDSLARATVATITGRERYQGREPTELLLAWAFEPTNWLDAPVIKVEHEPLKQAIDLPVDRRHFSYRELTSCEPLQHLIDAAYLAERMRRKLTPLQQQATDVADRLARFEAVISGRSPLMIPDPSNPAAAWTPCATASGVAGAVEIRRSWQELAGAFRRGDSIGFSAAGARLAAELQIIDGGSAPNAASLAREIHYNRLHPYRWAWVLMTATLVIGLAGLQIRRRGWDLLTGSAMTAACGMFLYGFILRWQIAGRAPLSNMYESLVVFAGSVSIFALVFFAATRHRFVPVVAAVMSAAGFILADVLPLESTITTLPPVLRNTIWLTIHVLTIMLGYGAAALSMGVGHVQLGLMAFAPQRMAAAREASRLNHRVILVAVVFLTAGIAFGSVWANASWGRYWGWDPKETWSLITLLGYLGLLHARFTGWLRDFGLGVASIANFQLVLMTYYGVNYVLGTGLHSYGFGAGGLRWVLAYIAAEGLFVAAVAVRFRRIHHAARDQGPVSPVFAPAR